MFLFCFGGGGEDKLFFVLRGDVVLGILKGQTFFVWGAMFVSEDFHWDFLVSLREF